MEKNITVLDENGNYKGQTYLKRARGLVKSGRAQRTGERTIRFCSPPFGAKPERTDVEMDKTEKTGVETNKTAKISPKEIADNIKAILLDTTHISKAYETIEKSDKDWKARAAVNLAVEHERTICKALNFYAELCGIPADDAFGTNNASSGSKSLLMRFSNLLIGAIDDDEDEDDIDDEYDELYGAEEGFEE